MLDWTTQASPALRFFRLRVVRFSLFDPVWDPEFTRAILGFFTLILGRLFRVERLTIAKAAAVIVRYDDLGGILGSFLTSSSVSLGSCWFPCRTRAHQQVKRKIHGAQTSGRSQSSATALPCSAPYSTHSTSLS